MIPGQAQQFFEAAAAQAGGEAGYQIDRGLRFNSADSAYLNRTPSSASNRKTWTWSGWVKRSSLPAGRNAIFNAGTVLSGNSGFFGLRFLGSQSLDVTTGSTRLIAITEVFRDVSAWYHIVLSADTTIASNQCKLYVNGVLRGQGGSLTLNTDLAVNSTTIHELGRTTWSTNEYLDGYLADVHFIDGQALDPTDFGEYDDNNVWQPKEYTFTTNPNNGTTWSSTTNGNFWTAISRGADKAFNGSVNGTDYAQATTGNTATVSGLGITGITSIRVNIAKNSSSDNWGTFALDSTDLTSWLQSNYASVGNSGTWIDVTSQFTSTTLGSISVTTNSSSVDVRLAGVEINGYVLLDGSGDNSFHLPFSDNSSNAALGYDAAVEAPTLNPRGGMDVVTYTGNGSTQSISSLAFQPDFVWIKNRSANGSHDLYDSVRGADLVLNSDTTAAEYSGNGRLTSFNSDGFILGSQPAVNINGGPFVAWCWRAGGTAVSNTDGTITSQVSASTDYGFSIVTYQSNGIRGASIGHGLNTAPSWVVVKNRDNAFDWMVGHDGLGGWSNFIRLNTSGTKGSASSIFADTAPTSSVFYVGEDNTVNAGSSVQNYVAYCWSEVSGFSKFGSFTHPSTTSLNLGFKPKFFLIKETDGTTPWYLFDAERDSFDNPLFPNTVGAEGSGFAFTANGSGISWVSGSLNAGTYIYAAFADRPGNNWDVNNLIASDGTIAAASGALPILNTTGDYGKGVGTGTRTDSDSSSIVLALPMNGINNGTTFTDYHATIKGSGTAKTITVNGNTKTSTDQNIFYGSSGAFDGTDDNLKLPTSADFQFGSGDFTIETWFRPNNTNRMAIYHGSSGTDHTVGIDYSYITQTIGIWASSTGTSWDLADGDSSGNRGSIVVPTNAWTHIAFVRNGDFLQLYVGGALDKQFSITGSIVDASSFQPIIGEWWNNVYDLNGYLADFRIYKGVGKYTSSFNPPNLEDAPETDSLIDTPTNYEASSGNNGGNYATWNPLSQSSSTVSNGNLQVTTSGGSGYPLELANFYTPAGTGKWYWEFELSALSGGNYTMVGMLPGDSDYQQGDSRVPYEKGGISVYVGFNGAVTAASGAATAGTSTETFAVGDILGWAFDAENGTLQCYKNGVSQGTQFTNIRTDIGWVFCVTDYDNSATATYIINFGQRPFAYTPPTGFLSLCTTNLPDPTIADGSTAFDIVNETTSVAGSAKVISGLNFSPDLVVSKLRNQSSNGRWGFIDIVRGVNKTLASDRTDTEVTSQSDLLTQFNSDGFNVGADAGGYGWNYQNGGSLYTYWAWDGGSSTVSNTDGSITSTVRDNASAGFSIVTYTGTGSAATVGHGLGVAPSMIIVKNRSSAVSWGVGHVYPGWSVAGNLDNTNSFGASSYFNSTAPTSTVFSVGASSNSNGSGNNMVAYCFAPVAGYSSFGSYTGNGSSDGPFVYTGMRPKWIMVKRTNGLAPWVIVDTVRNTYNVMDNHLLANDSAAENGSTIGNICDSLSNGFKIRGSDGWFNNSGGNYIYATFSEHPFKTSRAR